MTAEFLAETPEFPMRHDSRCPFDPSPELTRITADRPVTRVRIWDGSTPWLVTSHAAQRAVLSDPRFSADVRQPGYPHQGAGTQARRMKNRTFIAMDDPEHARLRRMLTADFAIRRVEALRPKIQDIVDELIDDMLATRPPADLVQRFALPLPSRVICELLGVPYEDHDFFQRQSRLLISKDSTPQVATAANERLTAYLADLVAHKEKQESGDDLLSRLVRTQVRSGTLTRQELASMGVLLLVAGHETTANMIALGTLALLQHPDQLAELRDTSDPKLVSGAVEELLRYLTVVNSGRRRVATEDVEVDGQLIRAGEGVIVGNDFGNRDPSVFPDPDRLDLRRDARQHVAFGFGVHQCLGQPLARVELQVVYGTLYRRVPSLRLAVDLDQVPFKHDGLVYGVYELPVAW